YQAEDRIRDRNVTGVQTCALPILPRDHPTPGPGRAERGEAGKNRDGGTSRTPSPTGWVRRRGVGGRPMSGRGSEHRACEDSKKCRPGRGGIFPLLYLGQGGGDDGHLIDLLGVAAAGEVVYGSVQALQDGAVGVEAAE